MSPARIFRCGATALALVALTALGASPARAHDQPFSWAVLRLAPDTLALDLTVHRVDAARALGANPDSLGDPAVVARVAPRLAAILAPRLTITTGGRPLAFVWRDAELAPARHGVTLHFHAPWNAAAGRLTYHVRLFPDDDQHQTYFNVEQGARVVREDVLDAGRADGDAYLGGVAGVRAVLATFIPAGIHHIFIGPDHILFIVGLLLLGGSLRRLLKIVTGFTLAHSITLALAATGVVHPPSRVVEPMIALSIVAVGLDAMRAGARSRDPRATMAFAFGLVHGFGFASVLRELGLPKEALAASLLGFNLGVEIGQACIVLSVAPLLAGLRRGAPRLAPRAVALASWGVVGAGAFWFVQRLGGHG